MNILVFILWLLAVLAFIVGAWRGRSHAQPETPYGTLNLISLGLAFWAAVNMLNAAQHL